MAIQVDASTPAYFETASGSSCTSASFTPPAGSLLVSTGFSSATAPASALNVSDSLGSTWTLIQARISADSGGKNGIASASWAIPNGGGGTAMTVSQSIAASLSIGAKVYVITGADLTGPVGGSTEGSSVSTSFTTTGFTIVRGGSLGFVVAENTTGALMTSSDTAGNNFAGTASGRFGISGFKTLGAAGGSGTFNLGTSGTPAINWISFEIKAVLSLAAKSLILPPSQAVMRSYNR